MTDKSQTTAHRCMCRDCGPCGCGKGADGHCETCADRPQTTTISLWPPTSITGLAMVLHEQDRTMGESTGEWVGMEWVALPAEVRDKFYAQALAEIRSGEFVLGQGWSAESHG